MGEVDVVVVGFGGGSNEVRGAVIKGGRAVENNT